MHPPCPLDPIKRTQGIWLERRLEPIVKEFIFPQPRARSVILVKCVNIFPVAQSGHEVPSPSPNASKPVVLKGFVRNVEDCSPLFRHR